MGFQLFDVLKDILHLETLVRLQLRAFYGFENLVLIAASAVNQGGKLGSVDSV